MAEPIRGEFFKSTKHGVDTLMSRKVLVMGNMLNKKELSHEINVNKNYNNVPSSHDSVFLFTLAKCPFAIALS